MTATVTGVIGRGRDVSALMGLVGNEFPGSLESTPPTTMPSRTTSSAAMAAKPFHMSLLILASQTGERVRASFYATPHKADRGRAA